MVAFREAYAGTVWVEVMLVKGLNDSEEVLLSLRDALQRIGPEQVQINVPVRPPAEKWVEIPDEDALLRAVAILGEAVEVIEPYEGSFDLSGFESITEAVLAVIRRHPMREARLVETLGRYTRQEVHSVLADLERSGQARRKAYRGQAFWCYGGVKFGDSRRKEA